MTERDIVRANQMKVLVITGSRADRNGLEVVHKALLDAGHQSSLSEMQVVDGDKYHVPLLGEAEDFDVAVVGGDRFEILLACLFLAHWRVPIAHIAGGDVTAGSADDRYRDAITALACIHFPTNKKALWRLMNNHMVRRDDSVRRTGSPAIDRVMSTPFNTNKADVLSQFGMDASKPVALVCTHPNTVGDDPHADFNAVVAAIGRLNIQAIWLGANDDPGGALINEMLADIRLVKPTYSYRHTVPPDVYYSLMAHCDVMIGNSSAMLYEAPCFGLPCVLVSNRQEGRYVPDNVWYGIEAIEPALKRGRIDCPENPYGDGKSAPRIVKALEEWHDARRFRPDGEQHARPQNVQEGRSG